MDQILVKLLDNVSEVSQRICQFPFPFWFLYHTPLQSGQLALFRRMFALGTHSSKTHGLFSPVNLLCRSARYQL